MEITEVRIKLMEKSEDRLRGFCSVTFDDCFVVRDLKIIEGNNGPFVAMPSRKLTSNCPKCRTKNHLRAKHCNHCGAKQRGEVVSQDSDGRARLYADIAHPVNAGCREMIQNRVIEEFHAEFELSQQPGYVSRYDDDYDNDWNGGDSNQRKSDQRRDAGHHRLDASEDAVSGIHSPDAKPDSQNAAPRDSIQNKDSGFGHGIFE